MRVPEAQSRFFYLPGDQGGWFVSALHDWGNELRFDVAKPAELVDVSRAQIVVGRRLVGLELQLLENYLDDIGAEIHSRMIAREELRWRSPRKR